MHFQMISIACLFVEILRDYYMPFSISALVLARVSQIKPDSEYHIFYINFYIADKIFELTNCKNKSFVQLANIFVLSLVSKDIKQCWSVQWR